jgi:hypothetical protein
MSTDTQGRKHQPAGRPGGGQFAVGARADSGTVLLASTPTPVWGAERRAALAADLEAKRASVSLAAHTEELLRLQAAEARVVAAEATNARQAGATGGELAEIEFMSATAGMELSLAIDDRGLAQARVDVDRDSAAAIRECMELRGGYGTATQKRVADLIHALDLETDEGPGHIGWHPWHSETRAEALRELNDCIEAMPESPDEPLWTERAVQLSDPLRVRRVELQARRAPTPANVAQVDLTRTAETANEDLTRARTQ